MASALVSSERVRVRLIQPGTGPGAITVLGRSYVPTWEGLNGPGGWQTGNLDGPRLGEEGAYTITLPNTVGADGRMHRDRFLCLTDSAYRPGDEWFEVYQGDDLLAVWTPTKVPTLSRSTVTLTGYDAFWLLKRTREFQAGFWCHSPRDVIEHYTGVWQALYADDYTAASRPDRVSSSPPVADTISISQAGYVYGTPTVASDTDLVWRAEAVLRIDLPGVSSSDTIAFGVRTPVSSNPDAIQIVWSQTSTQMQIAVSGAATSTVGATPVASVTGKFVTAVVERRDRWICFYVDGLLLGTMPARIAGTGRQLLPAVWVNGSAAVTVATMMLRRRVPFLLRGADHGDYQLPGFPTPGGLQGKYWSAADEVAKQSGVTSLASLLALAPTKGDPLATRLDPQIDFQSANPSSWQLDNVTATAFVARWNGSVYLDLAAHDVQIRVVVAGTAFVWVGRTRGSDAAIDSWGQVNGTYTSVGLRATLGDEAAWYPLVVEFFGTPGVAAIHLQMSTDGGGTWSTIPYSILSPYGCYEDQVRNESHYDALRAITDAFAYQVTCEPRQLESGEFPGTLIPRLRVGRDTDLILSENEATEVTTAVDAESTADALQADAGGLADPNGGAQLTAEIVNYSQIGGHLFLTEDYESLAEISEATMLQQRLVSLLALHSGVWEEVNARPRGQAELRDSFPLTGTLTKFAWGPGDGIRLDQPTIGVQDTVPRQIVGVSRDIVPAGAKPPVASFRQRPRSRRDTYRKLIRQALNPQRNYQQQLTQITSTIGSSGETYPAGLALFAMLTGPNLVKAVLAVQKGDASPWNLAQWGGSAPGGLAMIMTVTTSGIYDITAWAPILGATLVSQGSGSTGAWTVQIIATVRI